MRTITAYIFPMALFVLLTQATSVYAIEPSTPKFSLEHKDTKKLFGEFEFRDGTNITVAGASFTVKTNSRDNTIRTPPAGKKIDIKGDMTGSWTKPAFNIAKGDVLKITPSGTWTPPLESMACDANGLKSGSHSGSSTESGRAGHRIPGRAGNTASFGGCSGHANCIHRATANAPYAAMIYKIGKSEPKLLGKAGIEIISEDDGFLALDANITQDRSFRQNGNGAVTVEIEHRSIQPNLRPEITFVSVSDPTKSYGPFLFKEGTVVVLGDNKAEFTVQKIKEVK